MRLTISIVTFVSLVAFLTLWAVAQPATAPGAAASRIRIGIYDNRAIAIAYAASEFNPVRQKMAELKAAKAAGDTKKIAELEAWGKDYQRLLHFQGFAHVPVGDLLEPVKAPIAKLAEAQQLSVIAADTDFSAAGVDVVDLTDDLVALFKPSDRTRQLVKMLRGQKPVPLTKIADMPAEQ